MHLMWLLSGLSLKCEFEKENKQRKKLGENVKPSFNRIRFETTNSIDTSLLLLVGSLNLLKKKKKLKENKKVEMPVKFEIQINKD